MFIVDNFSQLGPTKSQGANSFYILSIVQQPTTIYERLLISSLYRAISTKVCTVLFKILTPKLKTVILGLFCGFLGQFLRNFEVIIYSNTDVSGVRRSATPGR